MQPTVLPEPTNDYCDAEEVCLRWNSHYTNMKKTFPLLLNNERYTDCTIATESGVIKCHQVNSNRFFFIVNRIIFLLFQLILSACSSYFDNLLIDVNRSQHPIIFMKGIKHWILKALIDFMYVGEIHIEQVRLPDLLEVAESLQVIAMLITFRVSTKITLKLWFPISTPSI